MRRRLTYLVAPLPVIAFLLLLIIAPPEKATAQSGWPPLDSNCSDGECVFGVSAGADDAGPNPVTSCSYATTWNEIYLGRCTGTSIVSGFRFANITLPRGTGIAQAYLVFTVDGIYITPITVAFYGENATHAQAFSSTSSPASRPRLSGLSTVWSIPSSDSWVQGQIRQSPDITAMVQAIVDKSGWQSGNALAILVEPTSATATGAYRRVFAFERAGIAYSARLVIRTGPRKVYLPLMQKNYQFIKAKSGIHLGSGVQANWSTLMQTRLTGGNPAQGIYPAVLVVLSNNLYTYTRGGSACAISAVSGVTNQTLYDYIKSAAQRGTKVIVRIYPSPGNFQNALGAPGTTRTLLTGSGQRPPKPGGGIGDYCTPGNDNLFRSIDDIANEMKAIRDYNSARGWSVYAFEPANEPNSEWWPIIEDIQVKKPWVDMDTYFKNLYAEVHPGGANPDIRVLAVPMAQSRFAEEKNVVDCSAYEPQVEGRAGGLLWMEYTWLETVNGSSVNYNDGWSWHNYWKYGEEASTANNACDPNSGHNFQAFPNSLKTTILNSPDYAFVTEADVYSPCIGDAQWMSDKGDSSGQNQNSVNAANAMRVFIANERGADYVAIWNLTIQYSDSLTCNVAGTNDEFAWHEAFRGATSAATNLPSNERYWFRGWWLDPTQP